MEDNDKNTYNQNFSGVYCTCQRPYPDPEDTIDDEMIQCVVCEDWYHFRHLESKVPDVNGFEEMICAGCTKKNKFLQYYGECSVAAGDCLNVTMDDAEMSVVDVDGEDENASLVKPDDSKGDGVAVESKDGGENEQKPLISEPVGTKEKRDEIKTVVSPSIEEKPLEIENSNKVKETEDSLEKPLEATPIVEEKSATDVVVADNSVEKKPAESDQDLPVEKKPLEAESTAEVKMETEPSIETPSISEGGTTDEKKTVEGDPSDVAKPLAREEEILNAELNQCIREIIEINKSIVTDDAEDEQPPSKKLKLNNSSSPSTSTADVCTKPKQITKPLVGSSFWPSNWRKSLCKCTDCLHTYKQANVEFLIDLEDTVLFYQEKGISKMQQESSNDREMAALNGLGHTARIEAVMGYNKLKEKLTEFLSSFVGNQRVVTEDDVNGFFQKMNESNKNKRKH